MSEFRNDNEKLIWASAYSVMYHKQYQDRRCIGTSVSIPECAEWANSAVIEAREALSEVAEGWGFDDDVYLMLKEMVE